jgi:hypothetical protein
LIFAELDRGAFPKSSRRIKLLTSGFGEAIRPGFFTTVLRLRSQYFSQRYTPASALDKANVCLKCSFET